VTNKLGALAPLEPVGESHLEYLLHQLSQALTRTGTVQIYLKQKASTPGQIKELKVNEKGGRVTTTDKAALIELTSK